METSLEGRVAIVTGGATGIGLATAAHLAARGATVVLAGRSVERGERAAERLRSAGGSAEYVRTDVRTPADVGALFSWTTTRFGRLDYLFNNAGTEGPGVSPIAQLAERDCDDLLDTNIKGVVFGIKHAVPAMLASGGGAIVNNASFVGTARPLPDALVYGATKAAVVSMTRALAAGYTSKGIRAYAVCPWIVGTPMVDRLTGGAGPEARAAFARMFAPSGRLTSPDDVASVVIRMFAGDGAFTSGDAVLVDQGGVSVSWEPAMPSEARC